MPDEPSILHDIRAAKCSSPWDSMEGSDSVRTCPICKANIYRVAGLDERQILEQVNATEPARDLTQIKFYRRKDGTLMLEPGKCRSILFLQQVIEPAVWAFWPLPLIAIMYVGYWTPPRPPMCDMPPLIIFFAQLVWSLVGFFVMRKYSRWWQRLIASLIFPVPVLLIDLLWLPIMAIYLYFTRFPLQ